MSRVGQRFSLGNLFEAAAHHKSDMDTESFRGEPVFLEHLASTLLLLKHASPEVLTPDLTLQSLEESSLEPRTDTDDSDSYSKKRRRIDSMPSTDSSSPSELGLQPEYKKSCRGKYRCGRCGQPKTNHECTVLTKNVYVMQVAVQTSDTPGPIDLKGARTITVRSRLTA